MSEVLKFPITSNMTATDEARLSRLESTVPRSVAGKVQYSGSSNTVPASSAVLNSGKISPSSGVSNTGNAFPFVVQGQFYFVSTGSTVDIYWDGTHGSAIFVMRRTDGSNFTVPRGSISLSGLSPGVRYGFAPFISIAQPDSVSFVAGDSGSPRYAFSPGATPDILSQAARTQRLTTNESITLGLIYFQTPAGGSSSSGPGTDASGNNPYTGQP